MAAMSNFKRALPAGPQTVVGSLRTKPLVEDSKAVLPAGMPPCPTPFARCR
jgi:recyclin-1